jgi:hypothetical protein
VTLTNAFVGVGIYPAAAMLTHDCCPNVGRVAYFLQSTRALHLITSPLALTCSPHITLSWSPDGSTVHARAALPIAAGALHPALRLLIMLCARVIKGLPVALLQHATALALSTTPPPHRLTFFFTGDVLTVSYIDPFRWVYRAAKLNRDI